MCILEDYVSLKKLWSWAILVKKLLVFFFLTGDVNHDAETVNKKF